MESAFGMKIVYNTRTRLPKDGTSPLPIHLQLPLESALPHRGRHVRARLVRSASETRGRHRPVLSAHVRDSPPHQREGQSDLRSLRRSFELISIASDPRADEGRRRDRQLVSRARSVVGMSSPLTASVDALSCALVIDEAAFVAALESGKGQAGLACPEALLLLPPLTSRPSPVRSAALDVFENEPKIHPGLLASPNVVSPLSVLACMTTANPDRLFSDPLPAFGRPRRHDQEAGASPSAITHLADSLRLLTRTLMLFAARWKSSTISCRLSRPAGPTPR